MTDIALSELAPDRVTVVDAPPPGAQLELVRARRAGARLVVLRSDLLADRGPDDPRVAFDQALGPAEDRPTRVIGPSAGGVTHGPGGVALVSMIGRLAARIAAAVGPELRLAVDLGHAWDLTPRDLVAAVLADARVHTIGLALPPAAHHALAPLYRHAQGRIAIFACAQPPLAAELEPYGVATTGDLGALARALATPRTDRPPGPRIAVVSSSSPLAELVGPAFAAAGLQLTPPSAATVAHLESELPLRTSYGAVVRIPGATERHAAVAIESLATDLKIDHVVALDLPGQPLRDPAIEAPHLAALATAARALATAPSPLVGDPEPNPRAEALVTAARLMRRQALGRDAVIGVLAALAPEIQGAPAFAVASLTSALSAASQLGYPVVLDDGLEPLADEAALEARWRELSAASPPGEIPLTRTVQRAVERARSIRYRARPMPIMTMEDTCSGGPRAATRAAPTTTLALPVREADLPQLGPFAPLAVALSRLVTRLEGIDTIELAAGTADDGSCRILNAHAALDPAVDER